MDIKREQFFNSIKSKDYIKTLKTFLDHEYKHKIIYPSRKNIFNAFKLTSVDNIKVVIFGQDPYPNPNQAMGLAFSVNKGILVPPSLKNIYREIEIEFNKRCNTQNGDLTYLAKQGVLLLNSILTVEKARPLSHNIKEYELFFLDVLNYLNGLDQPIVFMLWGSKAKAYERYIKTNDNRLILKANHPSPLSANQGGWFNTNIFKDCNSYLESKNITPINWINK